MSDSKLSYNNGGVSFAGLLTGTFIVLKLTGYITWSWWWVLSPLWISFGISTIVLSIIAIIAVICAK